MNTYLKTFNGVSAISSIGLDGEEVDQINFLEKPQIYVYPGWLVATASDTLEKFTCEYKILNKTSIFTAIGEVLIVKIITYGKVLVAGPSRVNDMAKLIEILNNYQLDKIIIDGAFSRQIFAKITQATILVIGANYSNNIEKVVKDASLIMKKFNVEAYEDQRFLNKESICILYKDNNLVELEQKTLIGNIEEIFNMDLEHVRLIYIPKALTNKFVEKIIEKRDIVKFDILLDSPTNIQVNDNYLENLFKLKNKIYVLNPINVAAVCYNPFSPKGYEFDNFEFKESLQKELKQKVFNVLKDGQNE